MVRGEKLPKGDYGSFKILLDGELVQDKDTLGYYLFDSMYYGYENCISKTLGERLKLANKGQALIKEIISISPDKQQVKCPTFHKKHFWDKTDLGKVLDQQKQLAHHSDGLVFTSENSPYCFGTTRSILKWKPLSENTVDLQVQYIQLNALVQRAPGEAPTF